MSSASRVTYHVFQIEPEQYVTNSLYVKNIKG